ncbi:MAG: recombinase [Bacteroidetes bacterium 46-16]|nr:MAG: recombinase [Bacteroidetes bacterium 46-16]
MLETTFSILFYLKKPKGYESGAMPVYMRITVNGVPKEITMKRECEPDRWNSHAQRAKGNNEKTKTLNAYLDTLERQVHEARRQLIEAQITITADSLKDRLLGKDEKCYMLLEVFAQHNKRIAALAGSEYAPATVQRYETTLDHVRTFLQWKYGVSDIDIKKLSYAFVTDFEFYLKSKRKCNHNSTIKYIANMRKIVLYCLKSGWINKDPFFGFKMTKKEVVREYLTEAELQQLATKQFGIERLTQVRDIFLFSCYTGLAFIDVSKLTRSEIATGVDGNQWIFTFRQKTDTASRIPLLPQAQAIIEKYKDHPKCVNEGRLLPILSNQKMNAYLKEVADLCGITKTLTFHIARHTFATTVTLSNGVPIETVSKMLGHKNIRMTQHYAKILDKKVSEDMIQLQLKLSAGFTPA